jgi:hypothetical protein
MWPAAVESTAAPMEPLAMVFTNPLRGRLLTAEDSFDL